MYVGIRYSSRAPGKLPLQFLMLQSLGSPEGESKEDWTFYESAAPGRWWWWLPQHYLSHLFLTNRFSSPASEHLVNFFKLYCTSHNSELFSHIKNTHKSLPHNYMLFSPNQMVLLCDLAREFLVTFHFSLCCSYIITVL